MLIDTRYFLIGSCIIAFFTLLYSLLVIHRYWQFQYFFTDNVYFQKALFDVARLQTPMVDHKYLGHIHFLGDHFSPTVFVLVVPLWLGMGQIGTQLAMVFPFSIGMVLALHVGNILLKVRTYTLVIVIVSYLYLGLQHAMIFGFHELHLVPFFFWLMVWAFYSRRKVVYGVGVALLLCTKESMPFVLAGWGLFLLIAYGRKYVKHALMLCIVSIVYFVLITQFVIPSLGGRFLYAPAPLQGSVLAHVLQSLVTPPEKVRTLVLTLASFGMLPIASIAVVPIVLQDFAIRYISSIPGNMQYSLTFHYGMGITPLLTFASIWSLRILEKGKLRIMTTLLLCTALIVTLWAHMRYLGRGPLQQVLIPDFYKVTRDNAFLFDLIRETPRDGTVMTMNHLGFALADRPVYQLSPDMNYLKRIDPKYIVYDLREEQSPANILPFTTYSEFAQFMRELEQGPQYTLMYKRGTLRILKKKEAARI